MVIQFSFKFNNSIWNWTKNFKGLKCDSLDKNSRIEEYLQLKLDKSEFLKDLKITDFKFKEV